MLEQVGNRVMKWQAPGAQVYRRRRGSSGGGVGLGWRWVGSVGVELGEVGLGGLGGMGGAVWCGLV